MHADRLIAVDIGNTSTKLGWFDEAQNSPAPLSLPTLTAVHLFSTGEAPTDEIAAVLPVEHCRWHIVSVHREATRLLTEWLRINRPADEIQVLTHRDLPIEVEVDFPERVGLDRLAAAVAANVLRQTNRAAIVIVAGSAITVNVITSHGAFAGGAILPGFRMAAEVLYGSTDLLPLAPLATEEEPPPVVGKNTEAAIRSGLFWGAAGAVREIMDRMAAQLNPPPHVLVTGGDLRQLARHLGDEATFVPNLVLLGIAIADRKHRSC